MKLSNAALKYLKSLHHRKFRQKYHNFMVEGAKIAAEVLSDGRWEIEAIFATPEWEANNLDFAKKWEGQLSVISPTELNKISTLATPNQVLLVLKQPDFQLNNNLHLTGLSLYLDNIRDPGNFGTILRIADWFGIEWVFCSENSVELFNPKTIHATMGAFLRVKCGAIPFTKLKTLITELPIYGAVLEGESVFENKLLNPALLVIGNESNGISADTLPYITHKVSIPKGKGGGAESLNAAVAAGILCAQFLAGK